MTQIFLRVFEKVDYPCYWLAPSGTFWMNGAAEKMDDKFISSGTVRKLLGMTLQGYEVKEEESGPRPQTLNLLTSAMRVRGLYVLPLEEGLLATFQGEEPPAMSAFSSHLREPLTNLLAILPLLDKKLEQDGGQYVEEIQNNCYSMLRVVANLECASSLETKSYKMSVLDMTALVGSIIDSVESLCKGTGIAITADLPNKPLLVLGNRYLLEQAILNVIRNSMQFTRDGNKIRVTLSTIGSRMIVKIDDRGMGIKPEALGVLFNNYFSAKPYADGEQSPGLGLGLAITREVVQSHGGAVAAESEFGKGTRITMSLPLTSNAGDILGSDSADYLVNRYSSVYVQLEGFCRLPGIQ